MNSSMKKNSRNQKINSIKRGGRRFVSVPLFLFIIVFFSSCGLASFPVVYPPLNSSTTTELSFQHNTNNTVSPNFIVLGYDIVYRIYDGTVSDTKIEDDASQYISSSVFSSIISNNWNTMTVYRRVNADNGITGPGLSTAPLYSIDDAFSSTSYSITIYVIPSKESYLQDDMGKTLYFNRFLGVGIPTENFTLSDFNAGDVDVPDTYTSGDGITVAFFCFTYGLSKDLLSLHSNMVYIGAYTF